MKSKGFRGAPFGIYPSRSPLTISYDLCDILRGEANKMKLVAVVGQSETGKTRLICRLIPELKKRGYLVSVIKHCAHGFSLDLEGKDSWHFSESGADGVGMVGPGRLAVIKSEKAEPDFRKIAMRYFPEAHYVIVEAGPGVRGFKKIEVLGKGQSDRPVSTPGELLAVVSEENFDARVPRFHPLRVDEIADFLEQIPDIKDPVI